jgi:O-acetyl-ADP-ribose deacetylase (regulator of RNase III)
MTTILTGNIFDTKCSTIVNPVNCEGVMGAGLALEFRLRYPQMFAKYEQLCQERFLLPGKLWLYQSPQQNILCFPTKLSWKAPTKAEYLELGLAKFVASYAKKSIDSIAFPLLGAGRGGLDSEVTMTIMQQYLKDIPIPVEIYHYDAQASDAFYESIKEKVLGVSASTLKSETKLTEKQLEKVLAAMHSHKIKQLNQVMQTSGIGVRTIEKIVDYALTPSEPVQRGLF